MQHRSRRLLALLIVLAGLVFAGTASAASITANVRYSWQGGCQGVNGATVWLQEWNPNTNTWSSRTQGTTTNPSSGCPGWTSFTVSYTNTDWYWLKSCYGSSGPYASPWVRPGAFTNGISFVSLNLDYTGRCF